MDYPDTHLQSAIRGDERKYTFRCNIDKCPSYLKPYLKTCPIKRDTINIQSECQYGQILSYVYNPNAHTLNWVRKHLPSALEVSSKLVNLCLLELIPNFNLPNIKSDDYMSRLISVCTVWEDIRTRMQSLLQSPGYWIPGDRKIGCIEKFYISGKFMLVFIDNVWYGFSYDQVMMISDTIWARCNVLVYHHLLPTNLPSKVPPIYIESCYKEIDTKFTIFGNNIYDAIKNWESIILGSLVEDYDPYDGGEEYLQPVLQEMDDSNFHFIRTLYIYIKSLKLSPDQYSELHGLNRHWGHPTVDEVGACDKTKKISQNRPVPKLDTIIKSVGCLKRQFIVSFIQKHGRWPLITNQDKIANPILKRMVKTHARHLNLYQTKISLEDWYNLEFGQEMEFDYHMDYTELLDDKAISPFRNEFRSLFNPTLLGYYPKKPKRSRRLLRAILEITELDIADIINKIQRREVPPEWFIVILHSKERELKIKPRLFAMMVLEMRMYFAVTEKNIAKNIFPYFPQQTMTMSESELSKRIYKFTEKSVHDAYIAFFVMIDFKSWNIHWSEMSTLDAFRFIDALQGLCGTYTFTHEFFSKCLMVLSSSLKPPDTVIGENNMQGDPEECDTAWYNHLGGWDGLRQKGWTIMTIALLLLVEHITGIQAQIVGQADNQICKILIPRDNDGTSNEDYIKLHLKEIKEKIKLFTDTLDKVVSDVGLVLKKEESLVSSVLTIYGKEMTLNGAQLSQASKKISRALAEVNTTVPSLFSKTLTLHSAGLSTAQKTHSPVIPCILANTLSLINFINGARYSQLTRTKNPSHLWDWIEGENALSFLLLGSGDAGGAPIQNILNYLYRGHPDSLTSYTTYLYLLSKHNLMAKRLYLYLQNRRYPVGEADPELLIANPCSTNIASFPLISSRYRKKLELLVQRKTINRNLQSLFPSTSQQEDKNTFSFLLNFRPLQPRLLHEIFRLTPTCSRLTFLAKFSNTRTVHAMLKEEQKVIYDIDQSWEPIDYHTGTTIEIMIDDIDVGMLSHLKNMYNMIRSDTNIEAPLICPTNLAKDMRQHSWKALIKEAILNGVTIPHPAHQFKLNFPNEMGHDSCINSDEYCYFTALCNDGNQILTERGPLPPYIGSRTREKVTGKIYSIPTTARPYKAAERAVILGDWCVDPNSSLNTYLSNIILARTDVPEQDLRKIAGRISGGTSIHRLDSHMGPTSTLNNTLANVTTHILFSTDLMGRFSQGRENYVMHFQGIIHTGLSLINIYIAHSRDVPLVSHLHYNGKCCEELIDESLVGGYADVPDIVKFPDNPLLYTRITQVTPNKMESIKGINIEDHNDSSWAMAFILLSRIRTRILSSQWGVTETSSPVVSSLGVQEILRIGIRRIIKSLAKLLYLHLDYEDESIELILQSLSLDIWSDIVSIILIPDVMIPTLEYLDIDGVPDAYSYPYNIARNLNRKLIDEVIQLQNHPNRISKILPFHLYGNVKLSHIMRMWGKFIYVKTDGHIDLREIIRNVLCKSINLDSAPTLITSNIASQIILSVIRKYGVQGFVTVWKENPLRISYTPPETLLRIDPFPDKLSDLKTLPTTPITLFKETYTLMIAMAPRSEIISDKRITYYPEPKIYDKKLRADHQYRIIGQVSTAPLKYMEIISKDNIPLKGQAICTADGESALGLLLYKLTGNPIIYNSLVNRLQLQPQRGYTYIPGSFLRYPQGILNAESNCLLGGDITQEKVQTSIIECAKKTDNQICVITCDAESSIDFSLNITIKIILSICYISYHVQAQSAIIKTYLLDSEVATTIGGYLQNIWEDVKLVTPCFSSYESTECFWVCKEFNPIRDVSSDIQKWEAFGCLSIPLSCYQTTPYISQYILDRRSYHVPLQQIKWNTCQEILALAKTLGYRYNTVQAFDSVTNNLLHYDSEIPIIKNLERSLDILMACMYKYLQGMQRVYEGKTLELGTGAVIAKSKSIHHVIELYITAYRNIILVLKLSEIKSDLSACDQFITKSLATTTPILDNQNKPIYTYKDLDEHEWRQKYLKPIWKIVGLICQDLE